MLRSIFSSDHPDPEVNRKATILIKIVWIVPAIITLVFTTSMFILTEHILRYSLILLILWTVSSVLLYFIRKGHIYMSAMLYVTFLFLMIFGFSLTGGGIKGHGIKLLPVIVLFAGITLGKKEIWLFGIIATLGGLALVLAHNYQLIPVTEPLGQSPFVYWLYITCAILLLCFLENLSVEELRKALNKSQKELERRKRSEELLRLKNEKLMEIASLQSHLVRSPVASALGLINLIKLDDPADPLNIELIPKLGIVAKELDAVIHAIVRNTEEIEAMETTAGDHD